MDTTKYTVNATNSVKQLINQECFLIQGKDFNVEIKHTYRNLGVSMYDLLGEHTWCLYVIIGPKHRKSRRARANKRDYDTDLGDKIYPNWHCGCTYYSKQKTYVKIGCDYNHVGDEYFSHCDKLPQEILDDAEQLYKFFE